VVGHSNDPGIHTGRTTGRTRKKNWFIKCVEESRRRWCLPVKLTSHESILKTEFSWEIKKITKLPTNVELLWDIKVKESIQKLLYNKSGTFRCKWRPYWDLYYIYDARAGQIINFHNHGGWFEILPTCGRRHTEWAASNLCQRPEEK